MNLCEIYCKCDVYFCFFNVLGFLFKFFFVNEFVGNGCVFVFRLLLYIKFFE